MKIKIEIPKMPGRCNFCASTSTRTAIVGKFQEMKS